MMDTKQYFIKRAYEMPMAESESAPSPEQLIKGHLRLVLSIARKKYHNSPFFEDILQDGNLALCKAAESFDPSLGNQFSSYATPFVSNEMMNAAIRYRTPMNILTTHALRKIYFNIDKYRIAGVLTEDQRNKMASDLNVTVEEIREGESRMSVQFESANQYVDEEDAVDVFQSFGDSSTEPSNVLSSLERQFLITNKFSDAIKKLNAREQDIIRSRWMQEEPELLSNIGKRYGVTHQRVEQIAKVAMKKIKDELIDHYC